MPYFALTIFLSAFLLFQVQPLIGKIILPWFGGTPAVWTTCMLFFQVLLLGGYAYAHGIIAKLNPRKQGLVHLSLLALAVAASAPTIMPGDALKPTGGESPLFLILALLVVSVGLPYFTLSATGSLLQAWFARSYPGKSPYPLYALSNAGSLLGLLTFPFLVEPNMGSTSQASTWFWGYAVFAFMCSGLAVRVGWKTAGEAKAPPPEQADDEEAPPPTWGMRMVWVGLAACGSTMLLAITNQISIDVASVPFLWVLPLSLYLLSFILCFSAESRYPRVLFYPLLVASLVAVTSVMLAGPGVKLHIQLGVYLGSLFVFVMVAHGELYRLRPHPKHLTAFYMWLSVGGAVGGLFVGLVGPTMFDQYYEMHVGLLATAALTLYAFSRDQRLELRGNKLVILVGVGVVTAIAAIVIARAEDPIAFGWVHALVAGTVVICVFGLVYALGTRGTDSGSRYLQGPRGKWLWSMPLASIGLLGFNLVEDIGYRTQDAITISRGFFGMLRVVDRHLDDPDQAQRVLYHGAIKHGFQFKAEGRQMWHNSYFASESGIGLALTRHPARAEGRGLKIGVLGLGAGTLLTYGRQGDHIRIYEIDPEVERLSREYFTYFQKTPATTDVVIGDGRLALEREEDQEFDILILDAFSSDAIPMHLLTREAFETYVRHLRPDGVLAANMSNRHVDIKPVIKQLAEHNELEFLFVTNYRDEDRGVYGADWGLMSRNEAFLADETLGMHLLPTDEIDTSLRMWTDDYTNLLAVLNWLKDE